MDLGKINRGAYFAPQAIRNFGLLKVLNSSVENLEDIGNLSIEVSDKLNLDNNFKFNIKDTVLDEDAPGVRTPCPIGLSYEESILALSILNHSKLITSAEFLELNPFLDINDKTVKITIELIKTLLLER